MPTIKVELPKYDEFPKLKKLRPLFDERVRLHDEKKKIETRLKGNKKTGEPGLNYVLFSQMRGVLPDGMKSVEYRDEESGARYCVSATVGENGRKTLNKEMLMATPWRVLCPCGCKKRFDVTLPPKVVEECTVEGAANAPSVSVRRIGVDDDE